MTQLSVNQAALATTALLTAAALASGYAAVTVASTVATVVFAILGFAAIAAATCSIMAWVHKDSVTVTLYFAKFQQNLGAATSGACNAFIQGITQGIIMGIGKLVSRLIAGPDHTVRRV